MIQRALLAFLFWIAAAVLVAACHLELDAQSAATCAVATIAAIVLVAFAYMHFCARCAGVDHALGVGIAWLVLAIVAEIAIGGRLGHGWYELLGTPAHPLLRNVSLFVWVFAPALAARRPALRNR
jgi:hypothetical protein